MPVQRWCRSLQWWHNPGYSIRGSTTKTPRPQTWSTYPTKCRKCPLFWWSATLAERRTASSKVLRWNLSFTFSPYWSGYAAQMTDEAAPFFYNSIIMDGRTKTIISLHSVTTFTNFPFFWSGLSNNIHKYDRIIVGFRKNTLGGCGCSSENGWRISISRTANKR